MRTNFLFYLILVFALISHKISFGQTDEASEKEQKTLLGKSKHLGFYFSLGTKFASFDEQITSMPTFKVAMSAGRRLAFGFEACGLPPSAQTSLAMQRVRPVGGYAGFFFEPIIASNQVIHLTFPVLFGGGWMGFVDDWQYNNVGNSQMQDNSVMGIIEPNVLAELNLFKWLRFNLGAGYRYTHSTHFSVADKAYFSGYHAYLGLKIGRF